MKFEDLKTKTSDELQKILLDVRKDQLNLRFQQTNGALDNTSQVRKNRRTIARIKTLLNTQGAEPAPKAKKAPAKKTTKTASKKKAA